MVVGVVRSGDRPSNLKVHWIFVFAVPMILIISLYFAVVRGPSRPRSDDDDVEKNS